MVLLRWSVEVRADLQRLYDLLTPVNRRAAARVAHHLRSATIPLLQHPRMGVRLERYEPREVRRLIVGDYELRYAVKGREIVVLNLWHTREDQSRN